MSRIQSLIGTSLPTLRKGRAEADEFINNITNKDTASTEQMEAREDQLCESAQAKGESDENADQEIRYHKLPKKDISVGDNQDDAIDSDKTAENSADNDRNPEEIKKDRIRGPGGGRKPLTEVYPGIEEEIKKLIDGNEYGSPMKVLHWIPKSLSLRKIADELSKRGFKCSHETVAKLLEDMGYSKQVNQKMLQVGKPHPDRDEQFQFIKDTAVKFLKAGDPVISVDSKKKREYRKL